MQPGSGVCDGIVVRCPDGEGGEKAAAAMSEVASIACGYEVVVKWEKESSSVAEAEDALPPPCTSFFNRESKGDGRVQGGSGG